MNRFAPLLAALLLTLAAPPLATAQLGPTNVPTPLTQTDDSQTTAAPIEEDNGLSTWQLVLIFGGAIGFIAVIAWVIMRDAHRAAPAPARGRAPDPVATKKSAREREREQARKRAKAKAARDQRKRNRPR
ncbi:MAG: hypothetical protein QOJ63_862 [Solirubrobacteraceae bacterium]|nr:hypothetical protein [Solirubrobacteraceae bacterium]